MTIFDYADKHPIIFWTAFATTVGITLLAVVILLRNRSEITIGKFMLRFQEQPDLPDLLSKQARKKVKNEGPRIAFAYSNKEDPPPGFVNVRNDFGSNREIAMIKSDECQFDSFFSDCHTVVFLVPEHEYFPADCTLSSRIARYCAERKKHCILCTAPGKFIKMNEEDQAFDPRYVTTVNFYSKLRETLYMLLYFSPLNEE